MKRQLSFSIHPLLAAVIVVGALFAALFTMYGLTRWASAGEVMGRVTIDQTDVGGKTEDETFNAVGAIEVERLARPATFVVDGQTVSVQPGFTGLDIDDGAAVAEAMAVGREGNFANQFLFWLTHIFSTTSINLEGSVNPSDMGELFDMWDTEVIAKPISPGSITLEDGELVAHYPATGVAVDREAATKVVLQTLLASEPKTVEIPTTTAVPQLTAADVDRAMNEAEQMLAGPVTMTYDGKEAVVSESELEDAFVSETVTNSPAQIVNSFDPEVIDSYLAPLRAEFEAEPVNAEFRINDDDTVSVIPGENGTRIDENETAERLYAASLSADRTGELPIVEGAEPDVTTEYLEGLNVKHLVSQFTTYHDCCENRVVNIQLMADTIDGAIVLPGDTFSINDYVGERTEAKGYLPAGSIVAGQIVDTFGGGVSQFATTFYNAVFWGGYQDVDHQPHSYYFSRYPEGIEATLFWRSIDLKFRNNRESAILIDTRHTPNSITVRFFGFNDGRTLVGDQRGGQTHIQVVHEGGPDALHVKAETSDRFNITSPGDPVYEPNPDLGVDQQVQTQKEQDGWSVRVTRSIYKQDKLVEQQEWVHRYRAKFAVFEVHPCKVPGSSVACPTTTTSTTVTTTTSGGGSSSSTTADSGD